MFYNVLWKIVIIFSEISFSLLFMIWWFKNEYSFIIEMFCFEISCTIIW